MAVVARADRVRVIGAIHLLCDTTAASAALKGELEAMAAQRTGDPGARIGHRREGYRWPFATPPLAAPGTPRCSDPLPYLIVGDKPRQPWPSKAATLHELLAFGGTNSRYASGATHLDGPLASCCGSRKNPELGALATINEARRALCTLGAIDTAPGPGRRSGSR